MKYKYADIMDNDISDSINGIAVSVWMQGCPFHCADCHNSELWDFDGGKEMPDNFIDILYDKLVANNVKRNLSILGGEPMCNENIDATEYILSNIKKRLPDLKVLLWTGRTWEDLMNDKIKTFGVLMYVDILIDGRYDRSKRDVTLPLRGSSNQRVIDVPNSIKENNIILYEIN